MDETRRRFPSLRQPLLLLYAAAAVGVVAVVLFAAQFSLEEAWSVAAAGILIAGASGLTGFLLGFLFAIPRTLQGDGPEASAQGTGEDALEGRTYLANTNLEQISDWLTKIIVGVGLTQLGAIPGLLTDLGAAMSEPMGDVPASAGFSVALVVYYLVDGFLVGYLWTRLTMPALLRRSDQWAVAAAVERAVLSVSQRDAEALSLVERQIAVDAPVPPLDAQELERAVAAASPSMRETILWRAADVRKGSWRTDKPRMDRTIPVFRALTKMDPDQYYAHAQLGFALRDASQPRFDEAVNELSRAIDLRGPDPQGWEAFELNRAGARIGLAEATGRPVSAQERERIIADLRVAAMDPKWRGVMDQDEPWLSWMADNNVTDEELTTR
jgi:hypothetical protein